MEADFWRYYKIDLLKDGFTDKLSWRRFLVFVKSLPEGSAFRHFLTDENKRNFVEFEEIENI